MGSVIVEWTGKCADLVTQEYLCVKMKEMAELSHGFFKTPTPIRYFNHTIEGNIILDDKLLYEKEGDVLSKDKSLPTYISCKHVSKLHYTFDNEEERKNYEEERKNGAQHIALLNAIFGEQTELPEQKVLFAINKVDLYGIEFRLFDARRLYPSDDRISFVFLRAPYCPELDGRLVYVEDHEDCKYYTCDLIKKADWFLRLPGIHLRYYCEEWMDQLLGWVKYFYIPGLDYWRYEQLQGYKEFSAYLDRCDREMMRNIVFDNLKEDFKQSAENLIKEAHLYNRRSPPHDD